MAGVGSKKFVLRPYKPANTMDQHDAVETFAKLQSAINKIYNQEQSSLSYEELYRHAYHMVLYKHGEMLYGGVAETVRRHLGKMAEAVKAAPDDVLLQRLEEAWTRHCREMRMVRDILMYMDRTFSPMARKPLSYDNGTMLFRDTLARETSIRARTQRLLLGALAEARHGKPYDAALIRNILSMLECLGVTSPAVYVEDFEVPLLEEVSGHYRAESAAYLATHSCPEYLSHAEGRLLGELGRAREVVNPLTMPKLESVLHRVLVGEHAVALLDKEGSGLVALVEREAYEDVARMYRLFALHKGAVAWKDRSGVTRSMPPLACMRDAMKAHLTAQGTALVTDPELQRDAPAYVSRLIALRAKYSSLVDRAMGGDKEFARAVKEGFELILNRPGDRRPPEYLSLYCDEHMRGGFKGMTDAAVDGLLNDVINLFRYLSNKDEFEEWYKAHLQKRLLGNKVGSDDAERVMIGKLKTECGFSFTSKLEGMFTDLRTSADFMERYKRETASHPLPVLKGCRPVEVDVTVLTKVNWPAAKLPPCKLPPEVQLAADAFQQYYLGVHTGRRLTWHTEKGTGEVLFCPAPGRRHELTVSTYQMAVLVMFNGQDRVPFSRMVQAVGVPAEELARHVLSLLNPKVQVLRKSGAGTGGTSSTGGGQAGHSLEQEDVLEVNTAFNSKMVRIKVPLISQKSAQAAAVAQGGRGGSGGTGGTGAAGGPAGSAADEDGDIAAQLETQRKGMLDASIVRIMKARKTLDHANLVAEVTRQLSARFVPAPADIKRRIEDLIEREYLERDAGDKKLYSYLA